MHAVLTLDLPRHEETTRRDGYFLDAFDRIELIEKRIVFRLREERKREKKKDENASHDAKG
jgi:hypothetical protein